MLNSTAYGGGPRTATNSNGVAANMGWSDQSNKGNPDYNIITLNIGYPNINGHDFRTTSTGNTIANPNLEGVAYYDIALMGYDHASYAIDNVLSNIRVNVSGDCNYYDSVRFAWKNEFGVWDWWTATKANNVVSDVERLSFEKEVINYSANNAIVFNAESRGKSNYLNKINRKQVVNTDWLTDAQAQYIRELFFSPSVFIQDFDNNRMLPVVITNASVTEKTNRS